jgi:hypothetical protein
MPALEESTTKVAIRNRKRRANRAAERDDDAAPAPPQPIGPNNARNRKQKEKRKALNKRYKERESKELHDLPASRETTPQPPSRKRPREMAAAQQPGEPDHLPRETTTDVIARKRAREMVSTGKHAFGPDWRETISPSLRKHLDHDFSTIAFLSDPTTGPSREHRPQVAQPVLQHLPRVAIDRDTGLLRAMPLNKMRKPEARSKHITQVPASPSPHQPILPTRAEVVDLTISSPATSAPTNFREEPDREKKLDFDLSRPHTLREQLQWTPDDAYFQRILEVEAWTRHELAQTDDPALIVIKMLPGVKSMANEIRRSRNEFIRTKRRGQLILDDNEWAFFGLIEADMAKRKGRGRALACAAKPRERPTIPSASEHLHLAGAGGGDRDRAIRPRSKSSRPPLKDLVPHDLEDGYTDQAAAARKRLKSRFQPSKKPMRHESEDDDPGLAPVFRQRKNSSSYPLRSPVDMLIRTLDVSEFQDDDEIPVVTRGARVKSNANASATGPGIKHRRQVKSEIGDEHQSSKMSDSVGMIVSSDEPEPSDDSDYHDEPGLHNESD